MRIWSLHPKYLDSKGLVALWRETLLAKKVLEGKTKGYTHHPQLDRFKESKDPLNCINLYLSEVYHEANSRKYRFDREKINWDFYPLTIRVSKRQIDFEKKHLLNKLQARDSTKYRELKKIKEIETHPLFEAARKGANGSASQQNQR
jgi:hypothetical protein